ncbi:acetyl-CoA synthetase-like protein [Phanerochaete sordida]|uniref:Acetyl-CoA synthetase-like protein n=1 Tax=Phanerochaete sordida TaxID=48140 RepID=A0A9P3LDW4_9APHY|nr:acetyl-CoA synthetase-like protein [Phanerochaete sordida]
MSVRPPLDGSLPVLPGFVDFHAEHNPERPWALLSAGPELPVETVTFAEFARATHRIAHALRPDRAGPDDEVVAVLVNCDSVLYLALLAGMIRAGLKAFPMSPRNSAPAVANMLKRTSCHRIISQPDQAGLHELLQGVQSELAGEVKDYKLQIDALPALDAVFPTRRAAESSAVAPYPRAAAPFSPDDTVFYLHSSGSTGFPKPVPQRNADMLHTCNASIIVDSAAHGVTWGAMALPSFHAMGIYIQLYSPLVSGLPVGLFAPKAPASPVVPTPRNTLEAAIAAGCTGIPTVPTFVEAWAKSDADITYLKTLKIVAFAGGPLASTTGTALVGAGVPLYPWYGGTEFGPHTRVFDIADAPHAKTRADWEWLVFTERVRPRWVPEGDGAFELQFLTCDTHRPNVENLEDARGYATSDLWVPHPSKPGLWRITGRKDDVLVLASGEKVVPVPQEGAIGASPRARGALMFGRARDQCGVLVEPAEGCAVDARDAAALAAFRNQIWPAVEEANRAAPAFAKIFKEMIIVTDSARPLPRAAKGTIVRKQALALYEKEINDLYETVENSASSEHIPPPCSWNVPDVQAWLQRHACALTSRASIRPDKDLFDQGFDSLYATFLRNRIIGALRSDARTAPCARHVPQNFVFEHPTLHDLALATGILVGGDVRAGPRAALSIAALVERYARALPRAPPPAAAAPRAPVAVLLTGATGAVGAHVLAALLSDARVARVYTLNRPAHVAYDRQQAAFAERGLDLWLLEHAKLVQLSGDLGAARFGLKEKVFGELAENVTHVIHNAWKVDFNHSLAAFEGQVAGTRALVDFCAARARPARLLFTSSVSAAYRWDVARGPVPEEALADPRVAAIGGYGGSKYAVEQILSRAAERGLECSAVRLGQVCGPAGTGAWQAHEWFPILVKTSINLGALPALTGTVSWVPADTVARTYVDLVLAARALPPLLNLVHPRPAPWAAVVTGLNAALGKHALPVLPYAAWLARVEALPATSVNMDRYPALKLLAFFRELAAGEQRAAAAEGHALEAGGLPVFATGKMQECSAALREAPAVGDAHAKAWVEYWRTSGFLP